MGSWLLPGLILMLVALVAISILLALPIFACMWREGSWCNRRRERISR